MASSAKLVAAPNSLLFCQLSGSSADQCRMYHEVCCKSFFESTHSHCGASVVYEGLVEIALTSGLHMLLAAHYLGMFDSYQ